jgi:multidrug resistance efflux pump
MKAEILEPSSSPPSGEVNYKVPAPSSSRLARPWRVPIGLSLCVLVLAASFVIAAISLHSHASPSSTPSAAASSTPADDKPWSSLGYVDNEAGVTPLYPLQLGRVESIKAKENEFVKAGTELFRLDDKVQKLKVRQAEKDLEAAQRQLANAEAEVAEVEKRIAAQKIAITDAGEKVKLAKILRDKQKKFEKEGIGGDKESLQAAEIAVTRAELGVRGEEATLAVIEAAKRKAEGYVALAKTGVEGKKAQLDEARHAVSECVVRAPADGIPLRILINKGEVLSANPRQPAIQFAVAGPLLVRAEVEQEFVSRVRLNQEVSVEENVTGQECARGKVVRLALWYAPRRTINAEIISTNSDNRTLECLIRIDPPIRIDSPSPKLRIYQRVRVQFRD